MTATNGDDPLATTDLAESSPSLSARTTDSPADGSADATVLRESGRAAPAAGRPPVPAPAYPAVPGYDIEGVLGRGAMGIVYKARHRSLKRTVALKMVLAGGHAGPGELARFRVEAEAVARLQHPNIVQIHDIGQADGQPYCALEFVAGGTLAGRLAGKPLSPREAAALAESLALAMQAAHARDVVHRDLKPSNVLIAADGTPKVTDFGLARQLDADSGHTQAGTVMGTPSYMAPEQAEGRGHEAGPAVDVYAVGAILYECLAGRPPFRGNTVLETLDQVRTQEPAPPSRLHAKVPVDLETVCLKALAKDPARRYPSAGELAADLRRFLNDESIRARPVGAAEKLWRRVRRNPAQAGLTAAVLVLGGIVAFVAARPRPEPAPPVPPAVAAETDTSAEDLLRLVADLDRTDPGWRLEQIEAKRTVVPDEENGALRIVAFRKAIAEMTGKPRSEGGWSTQEFDERIDAVWSGSPTARLGDSDATFFRAELKRMARPLLIARSMAAFPQGRIPTAHTRDAVSTLLPDHQCGRFVARLLQLDALVQIHDRDRPGATRTVLALANVARAYADEPLAITQLIRVTIFRLALGALERLAAQAECTDAELEAFQRALRRAAADPVLATAARGERGAMHHFFALAAGDVNPITLKQMGVEDNEPLPSGRDMRRLHAWSLRNNTEFVAIARQPPEDWAASLQRFDGTGATAPAAGSSLLKLFTTFRSDLVAGATRHLAELRSAEAALAVERYRLAHGEWPRDLATVVPSYLPEVPRDPYDGQPLRYRRTEYGVAVYSLGPDRIDHGGILRTRLPSEEGDVGFRLWDAAKRR